MFDIRLEEGGQYIVLLSNGTVVATERDTLEETIRRCVTDRTLPQQFPPTSQGSVEDILKGGLRRLVNSNADGVGKFLRDISYQAPENGKNKTRNG